MNAADTNVVVRFIVRDDPEQGAAAVECVRRGIFISDSVLMETEWVLRSSYRMSRRQIGEALKSLLSTSTVAVRSTSDLEWALDRHAAGADLADMLHLISVRDLPAFVTLDRRLSGRAGPDAPIEIVSL